jgi:hypothetical protein
MYLHIYIVTRYIAFRLSVLAAPQPAARHYIAPAHKVAAASDLVNLVKKRPHSARRLTRTLEAGAPVVFLSYRASGVNLTYGTNSALCVV